MIDGLDNMGDRSTSIHLKWLHFTKTRKTKALGKLGNIVAETFVILDVSTNVSLFAHPWKHCCGNKICFPRSKNVS
jgi:hypothetical protein